ncbi:hypothetical protein [Sphingobium xanthum]|uniref:hypothetical protein n=2 Tax=Sphingobium TaxID=165695 RepID=UPI0017D7072E|nr:hypothetical protein [Sphingobium xanthum]MCW2362199.1 hypothetical protein [Sphingobium sp. B10D3B]MCW2401122.1 hypothetical protein [Sphingobium sp. B10D7B]MCW2408102.1 hypothetical protein [Sphingobium xanthum]
MNRDNSMTEPRPAASLTASLLARRGTARPAMRRPALPGLSTAPTVHDDLGWNDMGEGAVPHMTAPTTGTDAAVPINANVSVAAESDPAPVSPAKQQMLALAEQISLRVTPPKVTSKRPASLAGVGRKAAFTLRIDSERHLRLRLLSAVSKRSAQQLLIEALDRMIAADAHVQALAEEIESSSGLEA